MTHLTMTGYYAGMPYCNVDGPNVDKAEAIEHGDKFYHATYAPKFVFEPNSDLCPKCRAEWDAAASDDDN